MVQSHMVPRFLLLLSVIFAVGMFAVSGANADTFGVRLTNLSGYALQLAGTTVDHGGFDFAPPVVIPDQMFTDFDTGVAVPSNQRIEGAIMYDIAGANSSVTVVFDKVPGKSADFVSCFPTSICQVSGHTLGVNEQISVVVQRPGVGLP